MLDWDHTAAPEAPVVRGQVTRLVQSISDLAKVDGVALTNAAAGHLVAHGCKTTPKGCVPILVGSAASAAIVTVGAIDRTHVRLYSTASAAVNLLLFV